MKKWGGLSNTRKVSGYRRLSPLIAAAFKISERVTIKAVPQARRFIEIHAAAAAAKRPTFLEFEISPLPDARIFWDAISIITDYRERIFTIRHKTISTSPQDDCLDVGRLNLEPFANPTTVCEIVVQRSLQRGVTVRVDPTDDQQLIRVTRLELLQTSGPIAAAADL